MLLGLIAIHVLVTEHDAARLETSEAREFARLEQGIDTLNFEIDEEQARSVRQNDISDMAWLLVEELSSIHARSDSAVPASAYFPGKKFAAHVYQRVGLLKLILEDLVAANAGAANVAGRP